MRLLDSLERRFGRYALRGILGYILLFQCIVFAVSYANRGFESVLMLKPLQAMDGEWWRLFSFMIVPGGSDAPRGTGILMFIFYVSIMLMFMGRIEAGLGTFRLNLFVLFFMLTQWFAAWLWGGNPAIAQPMPSVFYNNLLFVFAMLEPRATIMLFGLVPLTARTLALIAAGLLALNVIRQPQLLVSAILALAPFFCYAAPAALKHWRHRSQVGSRRSRFRANSLTTADSFHTCSVCGRTDASNPDLDFRITDDGTEYCADHLPKS
jgi:hypothetical protein